ncbi:MAG: CrcB family protein [Candidatus Thalassarchaeaceae archaeon]|jgi:CrcB protein|nr:CrcB family protein [Candidatus Thalassarchaeaceae archaeon]|tara:strand:- start:557 stop:934 length:378 start_codon:yes stop_codon:yes gene_type:complete
MDGRALFLVALGGAIGAMVRYLTTTMLPLESHWSTLTINLVGSLLLGIIAGGMHSSGAISDELLLLLGTGILGAFTTMSTFSMDLMQLLEDSQLAAAAAYLTSTALIGPLLAYVGWKGTSMVLGA